MHLPIATAALLFTSTILANPVPPILDTPIFPVHTNPISARSDARDNGPGPVLHVIENPIFPIHTKPISPRSNAHNSGPGPIPVLTNMPGSPKTDCGWHEHCVPQCTKKVDCKYECGRGSGFCWDACYGDANTPTCAAYDENLKEQKKAQKQAEKDRKMEEKAQKRIEKEEKKKLKKLRKGCKKEWWNWWCL